MTLPIHAGLVLALASTALAQAPGRQSRQVSTRAHERVDAWALQLGATHFPGGEAARTETFTCCVATPAGGMIVAGSTDGSLAEPNASGIDLVLARIGPFGEIGWISQVGDVTAPTIPGLNGSPSGPGGDTYYTGLPEDLVLAGDGTILVTGGVHSSVGETRTGTGRDVFVARFAADGTLLWYRQLGVETTAMLTPTAGATAWGDSSGDDVGSRILLDPSGGFWVAGRTSSSFTEDAHAVRAPFLAHFTDAGTLDGMTELGEVTREALGAPFFPSATDECSAGGIVLTPSGPLVGVSTKRPFGSTTQYEARLIAFDAAGAPLSWTDTHAELDEIAGMVAAPDGAVFVAGTSRTLVFHPVYEIDAVVGRYEPSTDTWAWETRLDAALAATLGLQSGLTGSDYTTDVALTPDGGVVVSGYTSSSMDQTAANFDVFTLKLAGTDGALLHVRQHGAEAAAYGLDASAFENAFGVCALRDGAIGVVGGTYGDLAEPNAGEGDAYALRLRPGGGL